MFERTRGEIIGSLLSLARMKRDEAELAKHIKRDTLPAFKNDFAALVAALETAVTGTSYQGAQPKTMEQIAKIGGQLPALEIALTEIMQQRELKSLLAKASDTRNSAEMASWLKGRTLPAFGDNFNDAVQAIAAAATGQPVEKVDPDLWVQIRDIGSKYPMLDTALAGLAIHYKGDSADISQHDQQPYTHEKLTLDA